MLHWAYTSGSDDAYFPGRSTVYPGDWEDMEPTYQTYAVCSVDANPNFFNSGIEYPDVNEINCPPTLCNGRLQSIMSKQIY